MAPNDSLTPQDKDVSEDQLRTIFDAYRTNNILSAAHLKLLRKFERQITESTTAEVASDSWAKLITLYDLGGQTDDVMRLGSFAAHHGIYAAGWIGTYLQHHYLQHGSGVTRSHIHSLTEKQQSLPAVALRLAYCNFNERKYIAVLKYCRSMLKEKSCPNDVNGLYLCSLLESGDLNGVSRCIDEASAGNYSLPPWAAMKAISQLHASGDSELLVTAIAEKFLAGRTDDRIAWEVNILIQVGESDQAEDLILRGLLEAPEDKKLCIILAIYALENLEWIKYESHLRSVIEKFSLPDDLQDKIISTLRCLDYLYRECDKEQPTIRRQDLKIPDSLYECLIAGGAKVNYPAHEKSVVLVGATMAAGGAERVLAHAYKGLAASRNYAVKLWLFRVEKDLGYDFYLEEMNIPQEDVLLLDGEEGVPEPFCWLPYEHARRTYNLYLKILEERPEVIHGWQDGINLDVIVAGTLAGVKRMVLHTHNMRPDTVHQMPITGSLRRIYRAALESENSHLVCVSDASLQDYLSWMGMRKNSRHHVVYNGFELGVIDAPRKLELNCRYRKEYALPSQKYVIGSAFRFDEIKRPYLWIDVAQKLIGRLPEVHFVIFGDGSLREPILRKLHELNIAQYFTLPGIVSDVPYKLCMLDQFLLTSRSEGLPTVVIEAQFAGVPIVAPDVGGISECIIEGESGELVVGDGADLFVEAILSLRARYRSSNGSVAKLHDFVQERFSHDKMIASIESLYSTDGVVCQLPQDH